MLLQKGCLSPEGPTLRIIQEVTRAEGLSDSQVVMRSNAPFRLWLWYSGAHLLAVLLNLSFSLAEPREATQVSQDALPPIPSPGDTLMQWPLIRGLALKMGGRGLRP